MFIFSLASSFAQTIVQLIVFRALTGLGGGGLITLVSQPSLWIKQRLMSYTFQAQIVSFYITF